MAFTVPANRDATDRVAAASTAQGPRRPPPKRSLHFPHLAPPSPFTAPSGFASRR
jgi:hypothetical protein